MSKPKRVEVQRAEAIASILFCDGLPNEAHRLVLTSITGKDLGGWCRQAVIDQIANALVLDPNCGPSKGNGSEPATLSRS